jgi:anti-sigma B factor antagonist
VAPLNSAVVLSVVGTIDMVTTPLLVESIRYATATRPDYLVIDLSKVEFLASAGMTVLLDTHATTTTTRLAVVAEGRATSRPMVLLGLDRTLIIYPSLDAALSGEPYDETRPR